ncbi:3,4-dihydroxy-2-butanone-4-phosphate synthase [Saccharopolyspora sp. TS4A08]|uniref:3,4-dihydroxy-2-butanone-4-phosphate synthase n=1 Tax=Saccharopolyspora ipomoeae TaxID=3042027 RepID=A0ABT6PML6_9PSEU|nr:3,4-dihydroxy-2-butanone-4-phosphate synthase [Saccharopolyspora sp. TS4A08]MDI2029253.1 3,4-dihydroxy-2-butanone-4-phosphate synthase [Saccharopolyspora sp. TS4A08]
MLIEEQDVALAAVAAGETVVVHGAGDEGGIVFPASRADVAGTAFAVRHSSGFLCVALPESRCDALELPPVAARARREAGTTVCVTVDAAVGVTTGISAADRARAARVLADPGAVAADLTRPGHLVPVAVDLDHPRPSLARAALRLVTRAGHAPAAVFAHLVSPADETRMATGPELRDFAADHGLTAVPADPAGVHLTR